MTEKKLTNIYFEKTNNFKENQYYIFYEIFDMVKAKETLKVLENYKTRQNNPFEIDTSKTSIASQKVFLKNFIKNRELFKGHSFKTSILEITRIGRLKKK
jgi:hypothetical protein